MKVYIAILLFLTLLGIKVPASFAQQDQNYQKLAQEMEILKRQLSEIHSQLQTVEHTEKMVLFTEFAKVKTNLINAEFGKLERELRDSNSNWLIKWIVIFLTFMSAVGIAILTVVWNHFKSTIDTLIAKEVEKRVNRFEEAVNEVDILEKELKEAIGEVNILQDKVRVLDKKHAAEMIDNFIHTLLHHEDSYPEPIRELSDESLLDVFGDETRNLYFRIQALAILANRESTLLISPALEFLNSTLDAHRGEELSFTMTGQLIGIVRCLTLPPAQEATYEGLTKLLNRLLRESTEYKDFLVAEVIFSIACVSHELNKGDWISLLKPSISHLDNEPEIIKSILTRLPDYIPDREDLEDYLLELLEKQDPESVNKWRELKAKRKTADL